MAMYKYPSPRENLFMAFQGLRRGLNAIRATEPELSNLIQEEKDVIEKLKSLAKEVGESSKFMSQWGSKEHFDLKVG
jgi:hypothetical protein